MSLQMKRILSKGILRAAFSNHFRMTASSYIFFIGLADNSQVFPVLYQIIVRLWVLGWLPDWRYWILIETLNTFKHCKRIKVPFEQHTFFANHFRRNNSILPDHIKI